MYILCACSGTYRGGTSATALGTAVLRGPQFVGSGKIIIVYIYNVRSVSQEWTGVVLLDLSFYLPLHGHYCCCLLIVTVERLTLSKLLSY